MMALKRLWIMMTMMMMMIVMITVDADGRDEAIARRRLSRHRLTSHRNDRLVSYKIRGSIFLLHYLALYCGVQMY